MSTNSVKQLLLEIEKQATLKNMKLSRWEIKHGSYTHTVNTKIAYAIHTGDKYDNFLDQPNYTISANCVLSKKEGISIHSEAYFCLDSMLRHFLNPYGFK